MNKAERQAVEWCVRELMKDDGDFHAAVGKLARMVGIRTAQVVLERTDLRLPKMSELRQIPEGPFRAPAL